MAMVHLRRAGHRAIAVVGSGTTMVGDPSGKSEMRQMLDESTIRAQGQAILIQLARYLHFDGASAIAVDNADWLLPLHYIPFLRDIGRHFSVNRMLAAEAYKLRLEKGLSFIEFNYQLLQAYDFLTLFRKYHCTLQMGGDDQWGNILAGHRPHPPGRGRDGPGPDVSPSDHGHGREDGQDRPGRRLAGRVALQSLRFLPVLGQLRRPRCRALPPDLHPSPPRRGPPARSAQGQRHQRGQAHPGLRGDEDHPRRARSGEGPAGRRGRFRRRNDGRSRPHRRLLLPRRHHRPPDDGRAPLPARGGHRARPASSPRSA